MPIVSPNSGNVITVEIQGKIDDLLKDVNTLDKRFDEFSAHNRATAKANADVAKQASLSWTDFRSMYSTVLDVVRSGQQVWAATGQKYIEYVDSVRDTARALGTTTEEAARLIQVGDDVFLSYEKMSIGMKMAQKQGIDPSIQGLAKLSDAYLKLAPGVERTQFLLKTFGKSGMEFGKMMELGGDAIIKRAAAIEKGLLPTEKAAAAELKFKEQVDKLQDSLTAMTYQVMPPVISALTDYFAIWTAGIAMMEGGAAVLTGEKTMAQWLGETSAQSQELYNTFMGLDEVQKDVAEGGGEVGDGLMDTASASKVAGDALKQYKDQLDDVSKANQDAEKFIQSYADFQKGYVKDHLEAVNKVAEAEQKLAEVQAKKTTDKDAKKKAIEEATAGIAEAKKGIQELEATWHESTQKMIYDMVMAKVSVDGLTDAEFNATQDLAVTMGIRTQAQADEAKAMMEKATAIADGIAAQENVKTANQITSETIVALEANNQAAIDGTIDATMAAVNAQDILRQAAIRTAQAYASIKLGGGGSGGYAPAVSMWKGTNKASTLIRQPGERDAGGSGMAGTPYMIGTGAQPEMFIPSTNGNFIPNADKKGIGTTYNIVINNPKKETAENSIRQELKKLSYIGVAA
jgi:hypothetical protein